MLRSVRRAAISLVAVSIVLLGTPGTSWADSDSLAPVDLSGVQTSTNAANFAFPFATTKELQVPPATTLGSCYPDAVAYGSGSTDSSGRTLSLTVQTYAGMYCDFDMKYVSASYEVRQNGLVAHSEAALCPSGRPCTGAGTDGVNSPNGTYTCRRTSTHSCSGTWQLRFEFRATGILPGFPPNVPGHTCSYSTLAASVTCVVWSNKVTLS